MTTSDATTVAPDTAARSVGYVREHAWTIAVWGAMLGWTCGALRASCATASSSFRLGRFDLGNMVQAVWSTTEGRLLEMTTDRRASRWPGSARTSIPFLVLLAPLWMVWPSPLALAFAQIAVVSLGALPVFWLGRRHLGSERAAGLLALGYLAYPWVATSAVGAIHPVTFAIPFLLFCIWFLDTDRLVPFAVCAVLAMSTGELMGLPDRRASGIWYALARGERLAGCGDRGGRRGVDVRRHLLRRAAASRARTACSSASTTTSADRRQGSFARSSATPVRSSARSSRRTTSSTSSGSGLPLLFLFVLSPGLAVVALPQLLANGLSDFRSMSDPRYHSVAAVIPFLIAATVFGIARIGAPRRALAAAAVLDVLGDARARRRAVGAGGRADAARRAREHPGRARRRARRRGRARARRTRR